MAGALLACERSYERLARVYESLTRDHECLRVLGGLSEAGFAEFIGIFRMAEAPLACERSYERLDERLRVLGGFTREFIGFSGWRRPAGMQALVRVGREFVYESRELRGWADCLKQELQDFLGFSGWRESRWMRSYERMTRDGERLREITRVYKCWAGCLKHDMQDLLGFSGLGAMLAQVRSYERMTSDGERLREITRVYECWAGCLKQDLQDLLGIFKMVGVHADTGALVRAYDERWRAFTRDHESLRVLGWLSEAGFAGFIGIFGMVGAMLAREMASVYDRSREISSVHERLRQVF